MEVEEATFSMEALEVRLCNVLAPLPSRLLIFLHKIACVCTCRKRSNTLCRARATPHCFNRHYKVFDSVALTVTVQWGVLEEKELMALFTTCLHMKYVENTKIEMITAVPFGILKQRPAPRWTTNRMPPFCLQRFIHPLATPPTLFYLFLFLSYIRSD